jgi:hypothetical protein
VQPVHLIHHLLGFVVALIGNRAGIHHVDIGFFTEIHDPEIFFGWAPEDTFFHRKIITLSRVIRVKGKLYHLDHPPQQATLQQRAIEIYKAVRKWHPDETKRISALKKPLLTLD